MNRISLQKAAPKASMGPAAWVRASLALLALTFSLAAQAPAMKPSPASGTQPVPKGTASISGVVVDAGSGAPVKDVTLTLADTRGIEIPATVKTGEAGSFLFANLSESSYTLTADDPRYARQAYGSRYGLLGATPLTLTAGQQIQSLKFALQPNAVISGRVLDDAGQPLGSFFVAAVRSYYHHGRRQYLPVGTAITDDSGAYRISNLGTGKYLVAAIKSMKGAPAGTTPGAEMTYVATYFPNAAQISQAAVVAVNPGAEAGGTDIRVARARGVRVKGRVIGSPAGQQVWVRLGSRDSGMLALLLAASAPVKADGSFEVVGVTPGSYILRAGDPGGMRQLGEGLPVQIVDAPLENVVLRIAPAAEIDGALTMEGDAQASFKGARIVLEPVAGSPLVAPNTTAGADGGFALKGVAPDQYMVRVAGGPPGAFVQSIASGPREIDPQSLNPDGLPPGKLIVRMNPAGGQVAGVARGQDGRPLSGATVALIPDSQNFLRFQTAFTDQNGAFRFEGVAPGDYQVLAWEAADPGACEDPAFVKPFENRAERVTVNANERRTVALNAIPRE